MVLNGDLKLFHLALNFLFKANSADSDQTPRSVASNLGLHSLPMSQSRFYGYPLYTAL